jgi:hypothetical protein
VSQIEDEATAAPQSAPVSVEFYAAMPNMPSMKSFCPTTSLFDNQRICPLRMMFMASYPAMELMAPSRPEPLTRNHPFLHKAVILLDDVVHVLRLPAPAVPAEFAGSLQFSDRRRVSRTTTDIDDTRPRLHRTQCKS